MRKKRNWVLMFGTIIIILSGFIWQALAGSQPPELGQEAKRLKQVQDDLRAISVALECYYVDNNFYPSPDYDSAHQPVIPKALTTPIAYLVKQPLDPYKDNGKGIYDYQLSLDAQRWMSRSRGPDTLPESFLSFTQQTDESESQLALLDLKEGPFSYDPSNGVVSSGDIWATSGVCYSFAAWDMKEDKPAPPEKQVPWEEEDYSSRSIDEKINITCLDMRFISNALESYYIDNSQYPLPDTSSTGKYVIPHLLTTPVAYIDHLMRDPFSPDNKEYYSYWSAYSPTGYYILAGYGPDGVSGNAKAPGGRTLDLREALQNPGLVFTSMTYDPTNGISSPGDIWFKDHLQGKDQLENIQKVFTAPSDK